MAAAARDLGYEYIAITDHSKGLKIAGGIDEGQLDDQARDIETVNRDLQAERQPLRVLRSIEMNLDPKGNGDMDAKAMAKLDLVLGCFHSALQRRRTEPNGILPHCAIRRLILWDTPEVESITFASD